MCTLASLYTVVSKVTPAQLTQYIAVSQTMGFAAEIVKCPASVIR